MQHGAVSPAWLSACKEERALTAGIMEEIASLSNLQKAYVSVKKNGGSGGVDGMDMKGFRKWARSNMLNLQSEVLEGVYEVSPVRGVEIPKPQGGYRQLGIPTLRGQTCTTGNPPGVKQKVRAGIFRKQLRVQTAPKRS